MPKECNDHSAARRLTALAALLLLAGCASAPRVQVAATPSALGRASVAEVADSVTTTAPLHRTHWGLALFDPDRSRTLYALNEEKHFVPASNTKLVVTAVALAELGPEWRYETPVHATGVEPGDSVAAALIVVGRGDPTLSERFHPTATAALDALADSVRAAGIRRIRGDLVIDASYFDDTFLHPAWEIGDVAWAYASPVAAFGVAEAAAPIVIAPGTAAGEPARVTRLEPAEPVVFLADIVTDTAGGRRRYEVRRRPGIGGRRVEFADTLIVTGRIPLGAAPDTLRLAVADPVLHGAYALRSALERRGVTVEGNVIAAYDSAVAASLHDPAAPTTRRVALWSSPPLAEIAAAILKPSQNWIAEQLLKTLGAERMGEGNWRAGLEVERRYLFDIVGIDSTAVALSDGSGLSAQNLLTPRAVVRLLDHARRQPWGTAYRLALPAPGEEEGTLERRLGGLDERVRAKTGTITHVGTLSGYLRAEDGRERIFSIMANASGRPAAEVRRAIDRIVRAMAAEP